MNFNIKIRVFILLSLLLISCGGKRSINTSETCFYRQNDFIVINFANTNSPIKSVPNISLISNEKFFLLDEYHKFNGDTLYIRFPDSRDVKISDAIQPTVKVVNDSLVILKSKRIQQLFKVTRDFKTISISNCRDYTNIPICK